MFRTIPPTLALTSLVSLAAGTLFASAVSAQMNPDEIVGAHNQWRQSVGSPPLRWSNQLAGVAQNWANRLASEGAMYHSSSGYGENLFSISGRRASGQEAVDAWGSEIQYFQNGVFPNVSTTGNWADVGHYTQMVWHSTTQVGCGVAGSARFEVWVCNYDPPGNVMGRSPFAQNQSVSSSIPLPAPSVPPGPVPSTIPAGTNGFFWTRQFTGAAFPVGQERNQTLYGCRVAYQGGLHPGKIVGNQCNFGFGGKEIQSSNYEVLSFQGQSNQYQWVRSLSGNDQPVLGGQEANGTSLALCRADYQGGLHPGKVVNGRCNIGYGGEEIQLDRYETLVTQRGNGNSFPTGQPSNPTAGTGFYWDNQLTSQAFAVGSERNQTLYSCRVNYQGGIHPGKLVNNQCNFGFGGKEITSANYQVLSFSGSTQYSWQRGTASNTFQSLMGGQEASGTPLAICRTDYGGGVHPGKVVENACHIGYGGREVRLRSYQVLRLN
ncbi:MAG: DM9 repeat-containing protein [Prochlorotrichaceae cyanobacterium]|jgi:uncharacterized protein YkwD